MSCALCSIKNLPSRELKVACISGTLYCSGGFILAPAKSMSSNLKIVVGVVVRFATASFSVFLVPKRRMFVFLCLLYFLQQISPCARLFPDELRCERILRIISDLCGLSRFVSITILCRSRMPFCALVVWIVRLVLVHGDGVPDHNVLPCSSFGMWTDTL